MQFTDSSECRMAALVRHFGDAADASRPCGICDVCDPGGAILRLFRRPSAEELRMARAIVAELRAVEYKAAGTLQRGLDASGAMSRDQFDGLLEAMVRAATDLDRGCRVRKRWRGQTVSQSPADRGSAGSTRDNPRGVCSSAMEWWRNLAGDAIRRIARSNGRQGRRIHLEEQQALVRAEFAKERATQTDTGNLSAQAACFGLATQRVACRRGKEAASAGLLRAA